MILSCGAGTTHAVLTGIVIFTRVRSFSAMLIASILAMATAPLFAAQSHDVCDAMRHGCASINALASCCCNGADGYPSKAPSARADVASPPHAVSAAVVAFDMPAIVVVFVREGPPALVRPQDFRILFRDLRL
jgi:hypothetical protein